MSSRISMSVHVLGGLAVAFGLASSARADDPATVKQLQDTVTKLEKKIADLEAKVAALEKLAKAAPAAKPDLNDEEYVKTMAGAMLDSLLAGDAPGLRNKMTENMERGIDNFWKDRRLHENEIDMWVKAWNKGNYKSHTIEKVVFSPNKDEIVVTGTLSGKGGKGDKEETQAGFTMTLIRSDKKLLLDAIAAKPK
jgi:hypothetical protein